jgi:2-keto-3-deoxy-L-rhamnonate aldolase RhmA
MHTPLRAIAIASAVFVASGSIVPAQTGTANNLIELWSQGKAAFGVFVPNEAARPAGRPPGAAPPAGERPRPVYTRAGAGKLAANPLYDFVFLNLEGSYDSAAVNAVAEGFRGSGKSVIVRVPAFHADQAAGRTRIREVFAAGAQGITFPHVRDVAEGKSILAAAVAENIDVWSPSTPRGTRLLMMMLEDPEAVAKASDFARLPGYSILACGIGSLTQALKGDRAGAEAGTQKILAETRRAKLVNMLTATTEDVEQRVKEGFLAILAQGQNADEAIKIGRAATGR